MDSHDLKNHIEETKKAFFLFLDNQFSQAQEICNKLAYRSAYHALGSATLVSFQAAMTFEAVDIEEGLKVCKKYLAVCDKERRRTNFFENLNIKKINFDSLTPMEIHSELCYAECLLQEAFLTFIQDENFISFIKGALKIKTCLSCYKHCVAIMKNRNWKAGDQVDHFQSGMSLGVGAFNLMLSLLPPKIIRVLEFIGFKASKKRGLEELMKGAKMKGAIRAPICSILLIMYHAFVSYIFGLGDGDLIFSQKLLDELLLFCPQSAIFKFLQGRLLEASGLTDQAIDKLHESINSQSLWKQFHHFCFWELMWCHGYNHNWREAMKYAELLYKENKWSKSICSYQLGSFILMLLSLSPSSSSPSNLSEDEKRKLLAKVDFMFGEVSRNKQRIAGKSIPLEKWAVKKTETYQEQQKMLILPAYELFYIWNGFEIISKMDGVAQTILDNILVFIEKLDKNSCYFYDNLSLLLLLKGVSLRCMMRYDEASATLTTILNNNKEIKKDFYLLPCCHLEMGISALKKGNLKSAKSSFEIARNDYTGYQIESRIVTKIQAGLTKIKELSNNLEEEEDLVDVFEKSSHISRSISSQS